MEYTFLQITIGAYLAVGFAKFMLCVPHISRVIGVMSRLSGAQRGVIRARYIFLIPALLASTSFLGWIPALLKEGIRFFVIYSPFAVSRDCIAAYRAVHENDP